MCILCDGGDRYLSKCYNDDWMKDMGYLGVEQRLGTVRQVMQFKAGHVEFATPDETIFSQCTARLTARSQRPATTSSSR